LGTLGGAGGAAGAGLEATDAAGGAAAGSGAGAQAMKAIATSTGILEDSIGVPGAYAILSGCRRGSSSAVRSMGCLVSGIKPWLTICHAGSKRDE
jgi:hypothetical protein